MDGGGGALVNDKFFGVLQHFFLYKNKKPNLDLGTQNNPESEKTNFLKGGGDVKTKSRNAGTSDVQE